MKNFKKILCPYDFSEYADDAIKYAVKLADDDTQIVILYAIALPFVIDPNGFMYYDNDGAEIKKANDEALSKKVEAYKKQYPERKFSYKIAIENHAADLILKIQQEEKFDLIVMGSHGKKGIMRLLMGSVAEEVMREAHCPVLIVKSKK